MLEDLENGELLPLNDSSYIFIELPDDSVPRYTKQMLFDIQVTGYMPIIVHPERNQELIEHPHKLYDFVSTGALTQITAGSVLGKFGKNIQKFTHELIDANLTYFIASNAHNTISRKFWMKEVFQEVRDIYNIDTYYMFVENSQLLVDNMNINRSELSMVRKKKFLSLF